MLDFVLTLNAKLILKVYKLYPCTVSIYSRADCAVNINDKNEEAFNSTKLSSAMKSGLIIAISLELTFSKFQVIEYKEKELWKNGNTG
jgi:hypothetical protein